MLVSACLALGCVSARPWRSCPLPCGGGQLEHAGAVLVSTHDRVQVLLTHASAGKDEHGAFVAGEGKLIGGKGALGQVKIYDDVVCAVHTRRVEAGRLAANVVLVPLAVVGELLLDAYGGGEEDWDLPEEPLPSSCSSPEPPRPAPAGNTR